METSSILVDTGMAVSYKIGVDTKGNDIVKTQKANDLNLLAADSDLMDLADIIGGFIEHPINEVTKVTTHLLSR